MLQSDSDALLDVKSSLRRGRARCPQSRRDNVTNSQSLPEIQPLPRWVKGDAGALEDPCDAHFFAGAALARLDQILRSAADVSSGGESRGEAGAEPVFAGALRQRLASRAATACAAMLRLREDEGTLRDAETSRRL